MRICCAKINFNCMEKEIVKLRQRKLVDGKISLYLDIYINGKRKYEYLRLYLVPEETRQDKQKNKETLLLAKSVYAKRLVEVQQGRFGFENCTRQKIYLADYLELFCNSQCKEKSSRKKIYKHLLNRIKQVPNIYMYNIDADWMQNFTNRILNSGNISTNSVATYLRYLSAFFNYAVKNKIIKENPCKYINKPSVIRKEREFLTIEELKKIAANDNRKFANLKAAFLFSCLTGFRHSDIKRIDWSMVHDECDGCKVVLNMHKTGGLIYQDISSEARQLMGERKDDKVLVFPGVSSSNNVNVLLRQFMKEEGIKKHITFHCARHTFALLLLNNSTDIYTVSKLLGHTDVKTTLIYAHILDKKKQEAVNSLPSIFN